jgi:hypothetical protein
VFDDAGAPRADCSDIGEIRFGTMKRQNRSDMVARVVPLRSDAARNGRVGGTMAERLALVRELGERAWALTKQPLPTYTRSTMPVKVTTLAEQ